jgi:long-chain acyl-CoA synthetase
LAREGIWEKLLWRGVRGRKNVVGGLAEKLRWVGVVGGSFSSFLSMLAEHMDWSLILCSCSCIDLPSQSLYLSSLVQLSIPVTRITSSSVSTSPIFASHFYDFQQIPTSSTPFSPSSASLNPPVTEFSFTPTSSAHADPSNKPNTEMPSDYSPAYAAATAGEGADWKVHSGPPTSNVEVVLKGIDEEGVEERGEDAVGDVWVGGPGVVGGQAKAGLRARVLKNGVFLAL